MKYCKNCGLLVADDAAVCPGCGAAIEPGYVEAAEACATAGSAPGGQGPVYSRGYENKYDGAGSYAAPSNGYAPNNVPGSGYANVPGAFGRPVPQAQTLSTGGYLLSLIVFMLPLVGLVMQLVWSFGGSENLARQSLARAYLIRSLIVAALAVVCGILIAIISASFFRYGYYY